MKRIKKVLRVFSLVVVIGSLFFSFVPRSLAEEGLVKKELILKVKAGLIALPEGEVARIPISAVRVRSSDIRDINQEYNAVSIEKLYKLKAKGRAGSQPEGVLLSGEKAASSEALDLAGIFPRETKKNLKAQGREVEDVKDTYLIQYELTAEQSVKDLVVSLMVLPEVMHVEEVVVQRE